MGRGGASTAGTGDGSGTGGDGASSGASGAGGSDAGAGGSDGSPPLSCVTSVAPPCALDREGRVYCWGNAEYGALGLGDPPFDPPADVLSPTLVTTIPDPVTALTQSGCALTSENSLWCWGYNFRGRVGDGTEQTRWAPVLVSTLEGDVAVTATTAVGHQCAIDHDGAAWCWGYNPGGQLGDGTLEDRFEPVMVEAGGTTFTNVAGGYNHTCALSTEGGVWCWGANDRGQLGVDSGGESELVPVEVSALGGPARAVLASGYTSCAVMQDDTVRCWGEFYWRDGVNAAAVVAELDDVRELSITGRHLCFIKNDGSLYCWANGGPANSYPFPVTSEPYRVEALGNDVVQVANAGYHICAVRADQSLWCFGSNGNGELGVGDTADHSEPVLVAGCDD